MGLITYADKVGIIPKTVHINQWWDDDANEVKAAINDNNTKIADLASGTRLVDVSAEWTSGLSFDVRADAFPIGGLWYSATAATVTLATADGTNDRIDLLIATSSGTVDKITGTASATPNPPDYDPSTQYPIKFVLVKALATTPDGVSTELMYDEDVGTPTEWAATENTAAARINTGSTNDAYSGTKSVEFTSSNSSDFLTLTRASTVSSANINLITFWVKLKADFGNKYIFIKFFDSAQQIGGSTSFKDGQHGFDSSSLNWQKISIDGSNLSLPSADVDIMTFAFLKNSFTGAYVDLFEVHTGSGTTTPQYVEEAPIDGVAYVRIDGQWSAASGVGDMLKATYDPTAVNGDAFDMDNMAEASTGKTTPVDADTIPLTDSAASSVFKKLTWANIKATLKTYFDTLYEAIGGGGSGNTTRVIEIALSDEDTDLATGTSVVKGYRVPYPIELSEIRGAVGVAPTGSTLTVDINLAGVSIFDSNKLDIDAGIKTSLFASVLPDVGYTRIPDGAELLFDIDSVGSTIAGQGLKVTLIGTEDTTIPDLPASFRHQGDLFALGGANNALGVCFNKATHTISTVDYEAGELMYVGFANGEIKSYTLTSPYDVSTAVDFSKSITSISTSFGMGQIDISDDGLHVLIGSYNPDKVYQYTLSTAGDLSTSGTEKEYAIANNPYGVQWINSGNAITVVTETNDTIAQYDLSSAYDITTASVSTESFVDSTNIPQPRGHVWIDSGTKLLVFDLSGTKSVHLVICNTAYDLDTAQYLGAALNVQSVDTTPTNLAVSEDGNSIIVSATTTERVIRYESPKIWA